MQIRISAGLKGVLIKCHSIRKTGARTPDRSARATAAEWEKRKGEAAMIRVEREADRGKREADRSRASYEAERRQKATEEAAAALFQEGGAGGRLGLPQAPFRHSPRIRIWRKMTNSRRRG